MKTNKVKNVLSREEMKAVKGGMQWTGCPSTNIVDCRAWYLYESNYRLGCPTAPNGFEMQRVCNGF